MITGKQTGKIMVNFDECEIQEGEDQEEKNKLWTNLYHPDYKLIFN